MPSTEKVNFSYIRALIQHFELQKTHVAAHVHAHNYGHGSADVEYPSSRTNLKTLSDRYSQQSLMASTVQCTFKFHLLYIIPGI